MKRQRKGTQTESSHKPEGKKQAGRSVKRSVSNKIEVTKQKKLLWIFVIAVITLVAYYPAFDNEITSWDDEFYLNDNPYLKDLSSENIAVLFDVKTYYMGNYHPLSMLSLSIDYAIGGEDEEGNIDPFIYHFTNIILHIIISLLVFWFVLVLLKNFNIAVIAGLLFGVHAIHVESVAWISERKDVLYALFFVASLISYVKYVDHKKGKFFILSLLFFLLSMFSKGQAVSLAVTLIIIDYLRGRKLLNQKVIAEKIPFFFIAIFFGIIAIGAQQESEALANERSYEFAQRIAIASYAFMQYIFKLFLPVNLAAIYPYPDIISQTVPGFYYLMIIPALAVVSFFLWLLKKKKNVLAFAVAFFIVNIFLLLQFIPVGSAVHADRYAYIPSIGFYILMAVLIVRFIENKQKSRQIIFALTGIYIIALGFLSFQRCDIWQDSETLWDDTIDKSPNSVIAWNNRGSLKDKRAVTAIEELRIDDAKELRLSAIKDFSQAILGKPDYKNAYYNRGVSRLELSKLNRDSILLIDAVTDFNNAIKHDAQFPDAYHNRGNAKAELGLLDAAMKDFDIAVGLNPSDFNYYTNRGVTQGKMGNAQGALDDFNTALELNPNESAIYSNRGRAKMLLQDVQGAITDYDIAIRLNPNHHTAYLNRGLAKNILKDKQGAIEDLTKAIQINQNLQDAYYWRGFIYLELKNKDLACQDLNKAYQLGIPHAGVLMQQYCQ